MASAALEAQPNLVEKPLGRSWRLLVAARACADGGVTRAELAKDLGQLSSHRLSPAELRARLDDEIAALIAAGHARESRNRLTLTDSGTTAAHAALGIKPAPKPTKHTWSEIRDIRLVAVALGIQDEPAAKLKLLARPDGLRAATLQRSLNLPARSRTSPARLRTALVVTALQRAFGNTIKNGLDAGGGISAKAGRMLAGQLAQKPRDFGTDARLIAALAAEAVGSPQIDADALRATILRRFVGEISQPTPAAVASAATAASPKLAPAVTIVAAVPQRPPAASRPNLEGFAKAVQAVAGSRAEGWPGNRKAYISDVWQAVSAAHAEWGLTEIEFKSMLAEAHRTGHVVLANADLKDRRSLPRIQQSALVFKNTVLHFVRVED
jgi:hypothetical protein